MDPERQTSGPYVRVEANPDKNRFSSLVQQAQTTILDVGCGETNPSRGIYPRCSWKTPRGVLWVGCDPNAKANNEGKVQIHTLGPHTANPSQMIFFTLEVDSIPPFPPDYISLVAPNPRDIAEEGLLYSLEKFLQIARQKIIIVLDDRTQEAKRYGNQAKLKIAKWAKENNLSLLPLSARPSFFIPNSADLGAFRNTLYIFQKR
ncbi:MAG: hypothetical protein CH104c_0048 [Candidatus Woesebacteria bacterium]|nr:MAG: hypothetical protein CH104c_0048 [Candidatus Woesebacteria bacterium]